MTPVDRMRLAVDYVREHEPDRRFCGPVPEKEIDRVAKKLCVPITGSYREFIRLLGGQNDFGYCGVNIEYGDEGAGTLWGTKLMRQEYGLPAHYFLVWVNEGISEAWIIDSSDPQPDGEFPVYWVFMEDWQESQTRIADSFIDAFEKDLGISSHFHSKSRAGKPKKPAKKKGPIRDTKKR